MWTGRQTLSSIEGALAKLHGEENQLDGALRSAVADAERLRKERGDALRELARIKLDEMAAGRLTSNLDAGERRAAELLHDYRLRITAAAERREALVKEVEGAEAERHAAAAAVERALEQVDTSRAEVEKTVQAGKEWGDAKAARDAVEAVAAQAEEKAAASEAELGAKKKPYDDDPLFAYLWRQRFGTSEYRGTGFTRLMDRIVARFIGYADARPNYAALIEIPLRLREHASAKRADVGAPLSAMSEIERRAMIAAGVEDKEKVLAEARHRLAVLDDTVAKKHALLKSVDAERDALVAGNSNPAYNDALAVIAGADSKDEIATLYMEARRTPTPADEAIVRRIEGIDRSIGSTDAEIAKVREAMVAMSRRRAEVEQVRDRFRKTGYDHPQTTFDNESDIGNAIKSVLEGVVRSGVLWDALRRGYGTRPTRGRPDFGGTSFPFPFPLPGGGSGDWRGDGWREPSSRGGWQPRRRDDDDDDDDDDDRFKTGGSF